MSYLELYIAGGRPEMGPLRLRFYMDAPLEAFVRINLGYGFRICGVLIYGFLINFKTKILIGSNFQCKHGLLFGQWLENKCSCSWGIRKMDNLIPGYT